MPEDLALILVVLGIAGWIIYAVVKAALDTTRAAHKGIAGSLARLRETRFQKKKAHLQAFVRIKIPAELERNAQTITKLDRNLKVGIRNMINRPGWQR